MKYIYFVRHGESHANAGTAGLGSDPTLTEKGREQAGFVAGRCAHLQIEVIISSTMARAKETAEIISHKIKKPMEASELLVERRFPTEFADVMEGEWAKVRRTLKDFFYTPGYRHSDEENFEDIVIRAKKALQLLAERKEEHILVVSHGSFLRDLMAVAVFKDLLTPMFRRAMSKGFSTKNTGLTVMRFNEAEDQWTVATWNDHAHLG